MSQKDTDIIVQNKYHKTWNFAQSQKFVQNYIDFRNRNATEIPRKINGFVVFVVVMLLVKCIAVVFRSFWLLLLCHGHHFHTGK